MNIKNDPSVLRPTRVLTVLSMMLLPAVSEAGEGMWIPSEIVEQRILEMQDMGLKLNGADLYRTDSTCLMDAVVDFGGFCTGGVISGEGLILTNHHCGLSRIQEHSSVEQNYIEEGFWAMSREEELPNPGLWVRFLREIRQVTDSVLCAVEPGMSEAERLSAVQSRIRLLEAMAREETGMVARVNSFFYGAEYYLFLYEEFRDVRLVAAPPRSIGKFGGDTDNWEWPRHTGDFSIFRVYADSNNAPAGYAPDNVPYQPAYHLPLSMEGVEEGDFTMVWGYPGTTKQYLLADELEIIVNERLPAFIRIRAERLEAMRGEMDREERAAIQYASKYSRVANYWKKNQGVIRGIRRADGLAGKRKMESEFKTWARSGGRSIYLEAMDSLELLVRMEKALHIPALYQNEIARSIELLDFAAGFRELVQRGMDRQTDPGYLDQLLEEAMREARDFFRDFSPVIDRQVFDRLMRIYAGLPDQYIPPSMRKPLLVRPSRLERTSMRLYEKSVFADSLKFYALLDDFSPAEARRMNKDQAYELMMEFEEISDRITSDYRKIIVPKNRYYRRYVGGVREMKGEGDCYPDANNTLRITYGRVADYRPMDAVRYGFQTHLAGIIEKSHRQTDDYRIPGELKALYERKDFGAYSTDGSLPVCFIASNHTTNGNSGSPVLNAEGEMIGLNFDRNWEGTMSDYIYDARQCRNITLDIRYVLFIIDQFAGAGYLIDEMRLNP